MKFEIYSFEQIEERARQPFEKRTSMISIGDPGAPLPRLVYMPPHILRLVFEDITYEELVERSGAKDAARLGTRLFNDGMANKTAEFFEKYRDETDLLICQCEYGQSRSAACAAAISEFLYGNGIDFFSDDRYYPNKLVYKKLLAALNRQHAGS